MRQGVRQVDIVHDNDDHERTADKPDTVIWSPDARPCGVGKMAKRKMLFHPDYVREKIRASQLINRLHKCAFGEISLTMTQLRAIKILLRKCIPDLAAEIKSDQTHRYVVEIPAVLTREQWLQKYGDGHATRS
jgi:hypothetical protein